MVNNIITVDLEDWYHICGIENTKWVKEWYKYSDRLIKNVQIILELLRKNNAKATFFVVGYIAEKMPELIEIVSKEGHEIATHGYFHRRIFDMNKQEFENDLIKSKDIIEKITNKKVIGYRAPEWSLNKNCKWALDILTKHGFKYDASVNPFSYCSGKDFGLYHNEILTKHGKIHEIPLNTYSLFWEQLPFSGGLPLRMTPLGVLIYFTNKFNRKGKSVLFYIHPCEFYQDKEKVALPFNRKFMHYFNRKVVPYKIEFILEIFNFISISEYLEQISDSELQIQDDIIYEFSKKNKKKYIQSWINIILVYLLICFALWSVAYLLRYYMLVFIFIFFSIFFWPWSLIFKIILSKK